MPLNMTIVKTSSDGAWQGDNPLKYAFPLLIIQTTLVIAISRFLAFLLKPFRQPKVVAEIAGGILLGPSALGRNKEFIQWIFPIWSTPILESVASIGLLFFLFLVGLELDLSSLRRSGKRAFAIALAGVSLPFFFSAALTFLLHRTPYLQSLIFMGVALSITAFPVLARILAELKLLTTHIGETAMAAAAFNDVAAWVLLALAVAITGNGPGSAAHHKSPLTSIWVLLSGVAFVIFMLTLVRPAMGWLSKQCASPAHEVVDEAYICLTLAGVMLSGFTTDMIGIHSIFGAFVFGLTIPKGGEFAGRLMKRIEDFVSVLLLPLYFASSGLKTDVGKMKGGEAWGTLGMVIATASAGKIVGTFMVGMLCRISARESLALGFLMNTKGLVELIVLNIGREKKVLNDEMFTILVLMALFTTFMTTPTVMAIYKPNHGGSSKSHHRCLRPGSSFSDGSSSTRTQDELRLLACVHGPSNMPSMINLIELTRSSKTQPLKLYAMHLVQLTDRSSSIMMVRRARKNGLPFVNRFNKGKQNDHVTVAFEAYAEVNRVVMRPTTAISALHTMHEDICHVAKHKRVTMIILPFHMQWRGFNAEEEMENVGNGWRTVNQRVLKSAPCSVGVLVDRGFGGEVEHTEENPKRVCVLFFGGRDDREALQLGGRMSESSAARVNVIRFIDSVEMEGDGVVLQPSPDECREMSYSFSNTPVNKAKQKEMDEEAVADFQSKWGKTAEYIDRVASNVVTTVLAIGRSGEYDLIVLGKGYFPSTTVHGLEDCETEYIELGPIANILASSGNRILSSVLVIQQHDIAHGDEKSVPKIAQGRCPTSGANKPSV